jgi:predicted porin
MNKKLMAVAVAGALAAPAVVFAQASTGQIYGKLTYEWGHADQGSGRPSIDYADSPGGSAIGFKGEEKLGGGLSAWFQCESSADVRGMDQTGLCTRNSAVGFKGGWGNLHFGRWDTPFKRVMGSVGAEETGLLGMSFVAFGGSGGADATASNDSIQRQRWKRREAGLGYYESPKFNGFQVLAAISSGNFAADSKAVDASFGEEPRIGSLGFGYNNGPIRLGLGYEKHWAFSGTSNTNGPALNNVNTGDDRGWGISGEYDFGKITVGATYLDTNYETGFGRNLKKKTWTIGIEAELSGPHGLEAQYAKAGDSKGNSLVGIGGGNGNPASGPSTGAKDYSIAYTYTFSKRTRVKLGYHKTDNDANANYKLGNTAGALTAGDSQSAFAFHISHKF